MTREMISPNHMLGVISSPKSSLPHLVFLHTHLYHRGTLFIYFHLRLKAIPITLPASWSTLSAISPPGWSLVHRLWAQSDSGTVSLGDLWAVAGSKSSDTCLIHICFRTHGLLIFSMCVLGLMWVRQSERERVREAAVPHYTSDGSVGRRRRKMN